MGKFGFFDPNEEYDVSYGKLPHWEQAGATYFITFRIADSLPDSVMRLWMRERDDWLRRKGINPISRSWGAELSKLPFADQRRFHHKFSNALEHQLDKNHGKCVLRDDSVAKIVADSLHHFDGQRYHLGNFVIMPNHVHVLVCFVGETRLRSQCYSWKSFIAKKINSLMGSSGTFWQPESFDHLVRDVEHFEKFQRYIANNPAKAGLKSGEYILYEMSP